MAAPDIAPQKDLWLRAVVYGLLAEVATIFTIVAVVMLYRYVFVRTLSETEYVSFGERAGAWLGIIGGTLYVFFFARRLMRWLSARFVAHGIVVAIAAIALSVGGSLAGHQGVPPAYAFASTLKLVTGILAGWLASRRAYLTS